MVEITDSPSILLADMAGSRLPVVVSHGEGRAVFADGAMDQVQTALRYVDGLGQPTETIRSIPTVRRAALPGSQRQTAALPS